MEGRIDRVKDETIVVTGEEIARHRNNYGCEINDEKKLSLLSKNKQDIQNTLTETQETR